MKSKNNKLEDVLNEWQNNLQFREAFNKNPEAALKSSGMKLNKADLKKIRSMLDLKKEKDEKLDDRINK